MHFCDAGFAWTPSPPQKAKKLFDGLAREVESKVRAATQNERPLRPRPNAPPACLALAGLTYWLLNPTVPRVPNHVAEAAVPTLTQGLLQMEDETRRKQHALQTALVGSSRQVRGDVAWSMSVLER